MLLLGEQHFVQLFKTIAELCKIGRSRKYQNDLHDENFMHRNDGIPVIVDPWVLRGR